MRMDYNTIAIVWLILALAIFGKWHSVRCEVFSSSELSSIDETIAELMSCRRIPGRSRYESFAKSEMLAMLQG